MSCLNELFERTRHFCGLFIKLLLMRHVEKAETYRQSSKVTKKLD